MDIQDNAALDSGEASISVVTPAGDHDFRSVSQAARALAQARHKGRQDQTAIGDNSDSLAAAEVSDDEAAGSEANAGADPARPIEPPKSWSEEDQGALEGPSARDAGAAGGTRAGLCRRASAPADRGRRGAPSPGRRAREGGRGEATLRRRIAGALQVLQAQQGDDFADIKTQADVDRIAKDDMARYVKWSERQRQIALIKEQITAAQERATREASAQWEAFGKRQDELFVEKVPEYADPAKAAKLQEGAVALLKDVGFTEQELGQLWTGRANMTLRDHRVQLLIPSTASSTAKRSRRPSTPSPSLSRRYSGPASRSLAGRRRTPPSKP